MSRLLAAPNVSEGRDQETVEKIGEAFDAELLDVHSDPDHNRSVFTLAGEPQSLARALTRGAKETLQRIDLSRHRGLHPHVGALDVAPIVYLDDADRGAACAEALVVGDLLASELELPVFLYGLLASGRTRAELRRGGPSELARRVGAGELVPDFGPHALHPTAGATLVAARPPLIAFNVELAPPAGEADAKRIAAGIRGQLPGVTAIGLWLANRGVAQVSTNIGDHHATSPAEVVDAVRAHAPVLEAELVGLAPEAAFAQFPGDVPLRNKRLIEDLLA